MIVIQDVGLSIIFQKISGVTLDIFARQDGEYLNQYLFLRIASWHKRLASKYFSEDVIAQWIIKQNSFINYNGNLMIRQLASKFMSLNYVGNFFAKYLQYMHLQIFI